jgi:Zn-dependent M28 family amino/carboxypeptidase
VVLTAHYDHLGIENGVVFNGADDDGSGTVALLEIAESFSQALKDGNGPRRTILIMPVTAEEKGLLGSKFYVKNPVFPLKETIANLNIDMIGRTDNFHTNPNYVYVIGSDRLSDDLHRMNEEAAKEYGKVELDYKYNTKDDPNRFYYRSDHYNFVVHGVPSIFYFSGIHEDYHQPTDTVDKIDFEKMENVARMIFLTAWKLANSNDRPVVNRISE